MLQQRGPIELSRPLWVAVMTLAIVFCSWASWTSGRIGLSRLLAKYGTVSADADSIDAATALTPAEAEAYYDRGSMLNYLGNHPAAVSEFEIAASLRPRDYLLWSDLALTRDQAGDAAGALVAFNEAVRLAPSYSRPRWQRGNLLFRMGRYDEAFADLRLAVDRDPAQLLGFIDLCWGAAQHNAALTEQLLQARTAETHTALALFFARHDRPDEALAHCNAAGTVAVQSRRDLIKELIHSGALRQAFAIWRGSNPAAAQAGWETIFDGSFEGNLNFDESGFGWRPLRDEPGASLSLDADHPASGARSLKVTYNGSANPGAQLLSQLVIVEPSASYRLSVAVRTKDIVTGGLPLLLVRDAGGDRQELGRSVPFGPGTTDWKVSTLDFTTGATTQAIAIALTRENCTSNPCPIFGSLNLDSVALLRVK